MLNQYISTFQGFFSRAFWFGSFLPVALFAFLHLAIAWLCFGDSVPLWTWLAAKPDTLTLFPAAFAGLVVLGYVLTPIVPILRGMLDGSLLPEWLHDALRREHAADARIIRDKINIANRLCNTYKRSRENVQPFWVARTVGVALGAITNTPAITAAQAAVTGLRTQVDRQQLPPADQFEQAAGALVAALRTNSADIRDGTPNAAWSQRLSATQNALFAILNECDTEAKHREEILRARYSRVAYDDPQATRMADVRLLIESYSSKAYNADFGYIWPRLQLALPEQGAPGAVGSFNDRLMAARAQVDFAVLSLALALTIPLVWLPLLAWRGNSVLLFLGIGVAGPLVAGFFYHIAVESQIAFGEVVKAAIDKYRFSLLTDLRQPLPATLSAEREIWGKLRVAEQAAEMTDLVYRHPKSSP